MQELLGGGGGDVRFMSSDRTVVSSHEVDVWCALLTPRLPPPLLSHQLTRLVPGGWIPRLERMVESRGLGSFEKNVLLSLIGSVIQPNKVGGARAGRHCD